LRTGADVLQSEIAGVSGVSTSQVADIEAARSRPRTGTLRAIVEALTAIEPTVGDAGEVLDELSALAGDDGIAPDGIEGYAERVARTRAGRARPLAEVCGRRALRIATAKLRDARAQGRLEELMRAADEMLDAVGARRLGWAADEDGPVSAP
jgi:transcriptional regulator with XRE-family HTH domain